MYLIRERGYFLFKKHLINKKKTFLVHVCIYKVYRRLNFLEGKYKMENTYVFIQKDFTQEIVSYFHIIHIMNKY